MAWGGLEIDPFDHQVRARAIAEAQTISVV
jgi:hypothetical protein